MIHLLKRIYQLTKEKINREEDINSEGFILLKLSFMIIIVFLIVGLSLETVKAEAGLKIYDVTKKTTSNYTGQQAKVTLNGKAIGNSDTPGILVNGTAVLPYDDIFQNSGIAADCSYDEGIGTVTISKFGKTIIMKIGSKTAKVNGTSRTMPVAPIKIKYVTKDKTKVLVPSRFVTETLGMGYTWNMGKSTVAIVKHTILLSYDGGAKFEYTGTQANVSIDGKKISLGNMPNIIINNTAMLRANTVFAGSKIKAEYTYNKSDKSITLSKNGNKLVMTIGSKTAVLNGKNVTITTAPVYVTNHETNTSYVMVPGSFTTTSLGYGYTWNSSSKTSIISTKASSTGVEGSDTDNNNGTVLKKWSVDLTRYNTSTGVHSITNDKAAESNVGTINSVSLDATKTKLNSETFLIQSNSPYHKLTSEVSGTKISIQADNQSCSNQTVSMNNGKSSLLSSVSLSYHSDKKDSNIELNVNQNNFTYYIALSEDKKVLSVTICYNALTEASIRTDKNGDSLNLSALNAIGAAVSEQSGSIYINLTGTINGIGDLSQDILGAKFIKQITSVNTANNTILIITPNPGYQYYTKESGSNCTVYFQTKAAVEESSYSIVIPKPTDISSSMISDEDYYLSHYFVITLKGDYKSYFNRNAIKNNSSVVSSISVSLTSSKNTSIKVKTSKLQGYKISSDSKNIYVKIGNPKDIYKNIVVLDPGHGGVASGATKNGTLEKNLNFKILYTIGKKYFNQDPSKLKVYYTRTSDVNPSLLERASFAKSVGADLFVSLHMNIAENAPNAKGTEVFYCKDNNKKNKAGLTSEKLAGLILSKLYPAIGSSNRSVKEAGFTVIKKNSVPAVLIELGFMSNSTDYSIITNETKQKIAANTIYNVLLDVFKTYPTGR